MAIIILELVRLCDRMPWRGRGLERRISRGQRLQCSQIRHRATSPHTPPKINRLLFASFSLVQTHPSNIIAVALLLRIPSPSIFVNSKHTVPASDIIDPQWLLLQPSSRVQLQVRGLSAHALLHNPRSNWPKRPNWCLKYGCRAVFL